MKRAVLVLMLASAAFPLSAGQAASTAGQDQSTTPKYKKKRRKVQRSTNATATPDQSANPDVMPKPAGAPGSSTAAPAPNPANPSDPTLPTTTTQPTK